MQTKPFSAEFEMLFWTLRTCANHSESFVTWRHSAWRMICDVKLSGKPTCIAALQNLKNTCYVDYAPLPITQVSNKVLSADSLPSNRRTFFLVIIWFWTVKWSKQKVLTGGCISRGRLALSYWRYEIHWLISRKKNAVLWFIIRTLKHDAKIFLSRQDDKFSMCE